jgi:hypothetical protein
VLDALGERVPSGEVDDLAALLPGELARALRRGSARKLVAVRELERWLEQNAARSRTRPV